MQLGKLYKVGESTCSTFQNPEHADIQLYRWMLEGLVGVISFSSFTVNNLHWSFVTILYMPNG